MRPDDIRKRSVGNRTRPRGTLGITVQEELHGRVMDIIGVFIIFGSLTWYFEYHVHRRFVNTSYVAPGISGLNLERERR